MSTFVRTVEIEKDIYRYIAYAGIIFVSAIFLGYYTAVVETETVMALFQQLLKDLSGLDTLEPVTLFLVVFFNNSLKTFFMMIFGIFLGIIPAVFIFFNGYLLGVISFLSMKQGGIAPLLVGVLPHGIIEIPVMITAGAYGLWLGTCSFRKVWFKEPLRPHIVRATRSFVYLFIPLLFVAAFIEVFITGYLLEILY